MRIMKTWRHLHFHPAYRWRFPQSVNQLRVQVAFVYGLNQTLHKHELTTAMQCLYGSSTKDSHLSQHRMSRNGKVLRVVSN